MTGFVDRMDITISTQRSYIDWTVYFSLLSLSFSEFAAGGCIPLVLQYRYVARIVNENVVKYYLGFFLAIYKFFTRDCAQESTAVEFLQGAVFSSVRKQCT
jgi:hypothetical protein